MKSNILSAALMVFFGACLAYAGVTIRSQDLPASLTISTAFTIGNLQILGVKTNAQIQALTCSAGVGRCLVSSSDEGDLYTNFGTAVGQFRNSRTGKLP